MGKYHMVKKRPSSRKIRADERKRMDDIGGLGIYRGMSGDIPNPKQAQGSRADN